MTFHDQISHFPLIFRQWRFSQYFIEKFYYQKILETMTSVTTFWMEIMAKLVIFHDHFCTSDFCNFIAGQFWKLLHLWLHFEYKLGQSFHFSMTFDIFLIFHDFSTTFHDHKSFNDFPRLSMTGNPVKTIIKFYIIFVVDLSIYLRPVSKSWNESWLAWAKFSC